jgi:hypothetical protein
LSHPPDVGACYGPCACKTHVFMVWHKSQTTWAPSGTQKVLLYVQVTVHRDKLRIKRPTRCIRYPKLYFVIKLHVSGIFCAHHQELPTVHTAIAMFHAGYVTAC